MFKTNVYRILDSKKIEYKMYNYEKTGLVAGKDAALFLNVDTKKMFKTLVTTSNKEFFVFLVPVEFELDLKKASNAVNAKYIEMIPQKDLLKLTGYVHGGCSPIGMKKYFRTIIDISAKNFNSIVFSAGKIGYSVEINIEDIKKVINVEYYDIIKL